MSVKDWSTSAGLNTSVGGINIAPGMARSDVDNAFRAVMAELRAYFNDSAVNVKDYGAVGDGTTDDTTAIQNAINASPSGQVFFPAGDYKITNTLTLTYTASWNAVNLYGEGISSKIVWAGGNSKPMLHVRGTSGAGWDSFTEIKDLQFYGNSYTGDAYSGVIGIQLGNTPEDAFSGVCNVKINHCHFRRCDKAILGYYESDNVWIENCFIKYFTTVGIYNAHGGSGWNITDTHITDGGVNSTGIRSSLSVTHIEGNVIQGVNLLVGIQIDGGATNAGKCAGITSNYFESQTTGAYGVILYGVETGVIENNTFNGFPGATLIALADVGGVSCSNIRIGPNRHTQSGGFISALVVATTGTTNAHIIGKQFTDGGVTTITGPFDVKVFDKVVEVASGVKFPATQVASADANTLDDYEEGTVTIGLKFGTTAQTTTSQVGYTKIGRLVTVSGYVAMGAAVAGTGGAYITGLPFTSGSATQGGIAIASLSLANVTYTGTPSAVLLNGGTEIALNQTIEAGTRSALTHANFSATSEVDFTITYAVA